MTPDAAHQRDSVTVTIKVDTRGLRRGLIETELAFLRFARVRIFRRLRLRWQLRKVNREPAP